MVKVKNLHNTSERLPDGYATWKDYWKAKKGYWPTLCAAYGCNNPAMLGGHVIKIDSADKRWYIVPLCSSHNNDHDAEFYVSESMLVPVN